MKPNRWLLSTVAAAAGVLALIILLVRQWVQPYPLPEVPADLTPAMAALDFTRELEIAGSAEYAAISAQLESGDAAQAAYALTDLQAMVRAEPANLVYGNLLRQAMVQRGEAAELVAFFEELKGADPAVRLQRALAYVDGLQNPDLGSALLGQMSLKSIAELDKILEENPYHWLARLSRGLNNLYWPVGLRRTDKAVADLGVAVAIAEALHDFNEPYVAMAYAAYGDALVKAEQVAEGVRVWRRGLERFPDSTELQQRVEAGEQGAAALVERERGIDTFTRPKPGLTDLRVIWDRTRRATASQ